MAKRLVVLMGMLAVMLGTLALPALAESEPRLTGVIEKPEATTYMYGTHAITDELGNLYALESDIVDLDDYVGQRVTVSGAFVAGYEDGQVEGGPPLFDVTHVESDSVEPPPFVCGQEGYQYGPGGPVCPPSEEIGVYFELSVEGEPPAGTTFFGLVGQQPMQLTDPDGDGLYEGILTLPADFGTFPIPVAIIAGDPANPQGVIKDFGEVVIEDGDVFSADYSFNGPPPGSSATFTYELAVECEPPADATFLGFTALESLVTTPLADPDGDGVYTASQTVPRFAPGPTPPGTEPIALSPVRIVQGPPTAAGPLGPEYRVIKDFGAVVAEDTTLSASVSFCDGTEPVDPVDPAPVDPAPGVDVDGNGSVGASDGEKAAEISGSAAEGSASSSAKVLPATGGVLPIAGVAGLVIVAGGLLMRRFAR